MSALTQLPVAVYGTEQRSFSASAEDFDATTARSMMWAAQLAYETDAPDKLAGILTTWGWTKRAIFAGRLSSFLPLTSAKGFIAASGGVSILAFSGTEPTSLTDWLVDFDIHKNAGDAHDGFQAGFTAVASDIAKVLGPGGVGAGDRILITGHSLGGALAGVAALRLVQGGIPLARILGVYTYGMPRVGGAGFAAAYGAASLHERTYRHVHGLDIVPQVPPVAAPFLYCHVGRKLACPHLGLFAGPPAPFAAEAPEPVAALLPVIRNLLQTPPAADGPAFPGVWWATIAIDHLPPALRDHIPDRYLRALAAL